MDEQDNHLAELADAARRVGSILDEQINTIVDGAERRAEEIRRGAENDAEKTRRDALESAKRVLARINALEAPLGELVQTLHAEVDSVERELEGHVDAEATVISSRSEITPTAPLEDEGAAVEEQLADPPRPAKVPPKPPRKGSGRGKSRRERPSWAQVEEPPPDDPAPGEPQLDDPAPGEPQLDEPVPEAASPEEPTQPDAEEVGQDKSQEPTRTAATPADEGTPTTDPQPPAGGSELSERWSSLKARFRGEEKSETVAATAVHCAVCQKPFEADSEEELRLSGWKVTGEMGLCPEDQAKGWQLPEGARLPVRQGRG